MPETATNTHVILEKIAHLEEKIDGLIRRVDQINGSIGRHEKGLTEHAIFIEQLRDRADVDGEAVESHQKFIDERIHWDGEHAEMRAKLAGIDLVKMADRVTFLENLAAAQRGVRSYIREAIMVLTLGVAAWAAFKPH